MHGWKNFVCGGLILLSASVPSLTEASTVTSNTNVYNANSVGCDMIEAGRYEEAARYFMAALNQESTFAPAWLGLSVAFAGIKDYDTSIDCAKNAIKFCDGNEQFKSKAVGNLTASYYERGIAYYDKGEFGKAIKDYSRAIELAPKFTYAYNNRGNAHNAKGEYDKAIADYNCALEIDSSYTLPYYNRAVAYKRKSSFEQALADCETYLRSEPEDKDAKQLRQEILEAMQKKG